MTISFLAWLKTQTNRQDDIGRFAREATADADAPAGSSKQEWLAHLAARGAGPGASKAFDEAWIVYSQQAQQP